MDRFESILGQIDMMPSHGISEDSPQRGSALRRPNVAVWFVPLTVSVVAEHMTRCDPKRFRQVHCFLGHLVATTYQHIGFGSR